MITLSHFRHMCHDTGSRSGLFQLCRINPVKDPLQMPSHNTGAPVGSTAAVTAVVETGATEALKVARKRPRRAAAVTRRVSGIAVEEMAVPATIAENSGFPARDPEGSAEDVKEGRDVPALAPTVADAPNDPAGMELVAPCMPEPGVRTLASAITPDERELEAILNGLMPADHPTRRMVAEPAPAPVVVPDRVLVLSELERPTFALRPQTRVLPPTASTASWVRLPPAVTPSPGPPVLEPRPRLPWRRTP